jgi:hypothetical protein
MCTCIAPHRHMMVHGIGIQQMPLTNQTISFLNLKRRHRCIAESTYQSQPGPHGTSTHG